MNSRLLFLLIPFTFLSCGGERLGTKEFLKYYSTEKSFESIIEVDSFELKVRLIPKEFMSLVAIGENVVDMPSSYIDSIIDLTENYTYVFLDFKNIYANADALNWGCGDSISLETRINYLNQDFQKSLQLVSGSDTVKCVVTQLERTFKLTDKTRILLGFDYNFNKLKSPLVFILKETNKLSHQQNLLSFKEFDKQKIKKLNL